MNLLSFGEVLWDIIDDDAHLGGAPLNFAAHMAQCGGSSAIMSRLGNDKLGQDARNRIDKLNVDARLLQSDETKPTGTVPVTLVEGQPDYFITPDVAFDYIDFDSARGILQQSDFDVLYFGTLIQRAQSGETLRKMLEEFDFGLKFYDVNLRKDCYSEEIIRYSLGHADIVKLNEDEMNEIALLILGREFARVDFVREIRKVFSNLDHVILTAGGEGCYVYDNHTLQHIRSEPVHVVDAIGAGDSFSAAMMYAFYKTGDIIKSAKTGNKIGGYVASSSGAIPKYTEEIKTLLSDL